VTYKPQRRQRYDGLSVEQTAWQLSDDLDLIESIMEEHVEDDERAFKGIAEAWQEWKLQSLRSQNRLLIMVALALLTALISTVVSLRGG
jgi:hypothetical protein